MSNYTIDWGQVGIATAIALAAFFQKWDSIKVKKALQAEAAKRAEATAVRDSKLDAIHGAVNGGMADQKRTTMILAKRIADLTKNPADLKIAKDAEADFDNYHNKSLS